MVVSRYSSSTSLYLPDYDGPPNQPLLMPVVPRRQTLKRSRALYDVAMGSSPSVDPASEIIDLTTSPQPHPSPPSKRQKTSPSSSSTPTPTPPPPPPDNPPKTLEVIDLTGIETIPSTCSTWSQSSWSSGSASSMSTTTTTTTTTTYAPPKSLLPPRGPKPLGTNWETLGPLDTFPLDPLTLFYEAPTLYSFPSGPSYNIIASNPEVAFLFHVKSVGAQRFFAKPVTSTDSQQMVPSSLTTTYFISGRMDTGDLNRLQRDMTLARKIGFLPFRGQEHAVKAVMNYSRLNLLCNNPERLDGPSGDDEEKGGEEEEGVKDKDGNLLLLEPDWYPGAAHFKQMAEEWKDSHPNIRAIKGVPGIASPEQWKVRKHKSIRKYNWEKWEAEVLRQRRGRIVG